MADYDLSALAQGLAASRATAKAENPFFQLTPVLQQVQLPPETDPWQKVAQGALAGLSQGLGDIMFDSQNADITAALNGVFNGGTPVQGGLSPTVFQPLQDAATLFNAQRSMDAGAAQAKIAADMQTKAAEALLTHPAQVAIAQRMYPGALAALGVGGASVSPAANIGQIQDPAGFLAQFGATATPAPVVDGAAISPVAAAPTTATPASSATKVYWDTLMATGDEGAANAAMQKILAQPNQNRGDEATMRAQFMGLQPVQDYMNLAQQFSILQRATADPSSVADMDFVYGIVKMLDPRSAVRGQEGNMVIESQGIGPQTLGMLNKMINGQTAVDRPALINLAKRHLDASNEMVSSLAKQYQGIAGAAGLNPSQITVVPQMQDLVLVRNKATGQTQLVPRSQATRLVK